MSQVHDLIRSYVGVVRRRKETPERGGELDCQKVSILTAAYLRQSGQKMKIYRRKGKVSYDHESLCCHPSGLHEWLEIPQEHLAVIDLSVAFRLKKLLRLSDKDFEEYLPVLIEHGEGDAHFFKGLVYAPDPYKRYEGVWNPTLRIHDWHLMPETDLINR